MAFLLQRAMATLSSIVMPGSQTHDLRDDLLLAPPTSTISMSTYTSAATDSDCIIYATRRATNTQRFVTDTRSSSTVSTAMNGLILRALLWVPGLDNTIRAAIHDYLSHQRRQQPSTHFSLPRGSVRTSLSLSSSSVYTEDTLVTTSQRDASVSFCV